MMQDMQDSHLSDGTFVVVDVETTGLSPAEDRITEIAMMKVKNGILLDEFSTLINPLVSIPASITNLTGIDNLMVADAPTAAVTPKKVPVTRMKKKDPGAADRAEWAALQPTVEPARAIPMIVQLPAAPAAAPRSG